MSTEEQLAVQRNPASFMQEVSNAMVGLYKSEFGRGSKNVRTYWCGPDAITCFMEDTFTPAERKLVTGGHHARVRETRALLQPRTGAPLCQAVECIVGRTVRSLHSSTDDHVDGLATETFVFYPAGREGPSRGLGEMDALVAAPRQASSGSCSAPGPVDVSVGVDELTPSERATVGMVRQLAASGTLGPLVQGLRSGEHGLVEARDALRTLGELDGERLVEIALDTLINEYVEASQDAPPPRGPNTREVHPVADRG